MQRSALPGVQAVDACSRHAFARHTHEQFGIGVMREGAQVSHTQVVSLLSRVSGQGYDFIKTEGLYTFDGQRGFSLDQGE